MKEESKTCPCDLQRSKYLIWAVCIITVIILLFIIWLFWPVENLTDCEECL